jgi:hypothetical protein
VANFIKRLNKGTNDRYKGKLPFIYFNCNGIGHFDNKCPHKKIRGMMNITQIEKKHKEIFQENLLHQRRHLLIR